MSSSTLENDIIWDSETLTQLLETYIYQHEGDGVYVYDADGNEITF